MERAAASAALNGFLNVYKPAGMSSFQAVYLVRKLLPKGWKIGHMGTLDPQAEGVLPIGIGTATRLFDYVTDKQKTYRAQLLVGTQTDTLDQAGQVVLTAPPVSEDALKAVLPRFLGVIEQIPPVYSAIHVGGKRLYQLAREGKADEAAIPARNVEIFDIQWLGQSGENRYTLEITCGKGTYIRTLCADIAKAAGSVGSLTRLIRTAAGIFTLNNAISPEQITVDALPGLLLPPDAPLAHLPEIRLPVEALHKVRNGNRISGAFAVPQQAPVRVYVDDRFAGIAQYDGEALSFKAMLLKES